MLVASEISAMADQRHARRSRPLPLADIRLELVVGYQRARLAEVFRQAASSRIITTAHAINAGTSPDLLTHRRSPAPTSISFGTR